MQGYESVSFVSFVRDMLRYVLENADEGRQLLQAASKEELVIKIRAIHNLKQDNSFLLEYYDTDFNFFVLSSLEDLPDKVRIKITPGDTSILLPTTSSSSSSSIWIAEEPTATEQPDASSSVRQDEASSIDGSRTSPTTKDGK